jgi:hypothetical protein
MPEITIRLVSAIILAGMVPLAVLISRDKLRSYRRGVLIALEDWMYKHATKKPLPSFEVARIKYELAPRKEEQGTGGSQDSSHELSRGSLASFVLPATIYSFLSALGFVSAMFLASDAKFWTEPNFFLSGMRSMLSGKDDVLNFTSDALTNYQWNTGAAISAGFIGAYIFTLQYLVGRVRDYELSPTSFLIASVAIIEGSFIVAIARHLTFSQSPHAAFTALAFILGYFPTFGITWLVEKARVRNLKRTEPAAYQRRFVLPTDMVDGIDMQIKFRLVEAGIHDVQNLATANPVLLYVETPYSFLTILDWIAQAQLIIGFGGNTAADLHTIGVRTIFDLHAMAEAPETRTLVLKKVWPDTVKADNPTTATPEIFAILLQVVTGDVHVRRIQTFWEVMTSLVVPPDEPPKSRAGPATSSKFGVAAE